MKAVTITRSILEAVGGKASERFSDGLAGLEAKRKKLLADLDALTVELESRLATGEDADDLAEKIVLAESDLKKLAVSRAPLEKLAATAKAAEDAAEAAKANEERRARRALRLQEKNERGRALHDAAVDGLYSALMAMTKLDVVEREAYALSGVSDPPLDFDADPSRIAERAMARVRRDLPPWVAKAVVGEVDLYPLQLSVYRRVFPVEAVTD